MPTASLQLPRAPVPNVLDLAHAAGHPLGLALVPQTTYRPHTLSDRRRYVEEVDLEQPIMFYSHGPDGCGIPLEDAIKAKFSKLRDRDDAMFEGRGPSVSIRLNVRRRRPLLRFCGRTVADFRALHSVAWVRSVEPADPHEGF